MRTRHVARLGLVLVWLAGACGSTAPGSSGQHHTDDMLASSTPPDVVASTGVDQRFDLHTSVGGDTVSPGRDTRIAPPPPPEQPPPPPLPPPPPPAPARGPFPIVLVHGFSGWNQIGPIAYFFGVADALRGRGHQVFVTQVDPYQSVAVRGTQLTDQLRAIVAESGARKLNIVAHSQGGLDGRFAISTLGAGDIVASLTTIATPHRGTYVADVIADDVPGVAQEVVAALVNLLGGAASGRQQDMLAALRDLSSDQVLNHFNPANPDDDRVSYYSYGGDSCVFCLNPVDPALLLTYGLLKDHDGDNDGLIPVSSARWGSFLGSVPTDHFGEIGQPLGLTSFDYLDFYVTLVDGLRAAGF